MSARGSKRSAFEQIEGWIARGYVVHVDRLPGSEGRVCVRIEREEAAADFRASERASTLAKAVAALARKVGDRP